MLWDHAVTICLWRTGSPAIHHSAIPLQYNTRNLRANADPATHTPLCAHCTYRVHTLSVVFLLLLPHMLPCCGATPWLLCSSDFHLVLVLPLFRLFSYYCVFALTAYEKFSSHTPSRYDPVTHAIVWDDTLCFPVRYRDLDRNSQLVSSIKTFSAQSGGAAGNRNGVWVSLLYCTQYKSKKIVPLRLILCFLYRRIT